MYPLSQYKKNYVLVKKLKRMQGRAVIVVILNRKSRYKNYIYTTNENVQSFSSLKLHGFLAEHAD